VKNTGKLKMHKEDGIPGEEKTDQELMGIYMSLKEMKGEAAVQRNLVHRQKGDISKIAEINDNSEHYMNKTSQELRKI
jgi:hypothetical protein